MKEWNLKKLCIEEIIFEEMMHAKNGVWWNDAFDKIMFDEIMFDIIINLTY